MNASRAVAKYDGDAVELELTVGDGEYVGSSRFEEAEDDGVNDGDPDAELLADEDARSLAVRRKLAEGDAEDTSECDVDGDPEPEGKAVVEPEGETDAVVDGEPVEAIWLRSAASETVPLSVTLRM